jgi:hypothetical protein
MFSACIMGTYHKPHPHHITIGVVGPAAATALLRDGLDRAGGSAFETVSVGTDAEAAAGVRHRNLTAALLPTTDPAQPSILYVANAGGRLTASAAESFARAATATSGGQLVVRDLRPLAAGDPIGVGIFMFVIVLTICGYLTATLLFTLAPTLAAGRRYAMIAVMAVLVPTIAYLIGGLGFGTFTGSTGTIVAFIAVGALYTLIVGVATRLLQVLLGAPSLFVSLAIFVFLNIPSLGATYTDRMLPSFWRFLHGFWLGAQTVDAERSILYFNRETLGNSLYGLVSWAGIIVALLLLAELKLDRGGSSDRRAQGTPARQRVRELAAGRDVELHEHLA